MVRASNVGQPSILFHYRLGAAPTAQERSAAHCLQEKILISTMRLASATSGW